MDISKDYLKVVSTLRRASLKKSRDETQIPGNFRL